MKKSKKEGKRGLFITFEGGEGSGKTTALKRVHQALKEEGIDAITTHEPGGTPLGKEIRTLLLNRQEIPLTARAELFLFLADRAQHVEECLLPSLHANLIVLCDRFTDSTLAYQGTTSEIATCCTFATHSLIPDLTLLFDVDPSIGLKRASNVEGGKSDRIEERTLTFHRKVRKTFLELAERTPDRFCLLDATLPLATVIDQAVSAVKRKWSDMTCLN